MDRKLDYAEQQQPATTMYMPSITKYCSCWPSYFNRWYIPAQPLTTMSIERAPPRQGDSRGAMARGSRIDFQCTWQEKRKKVREMVVKPNTSTLGEGLSSRASMEGAEASKQARKQIKVSVGLLSQDCHFITTSLMHQKLGTLSWYSPRWTGKMASSTDLTLLHSPNHGSHSPTHTPTTITPQQTPSRTNAPLSRLPYRQQANPSNAAINARLQYTDISLQLMARVKVTQHRYLWSVSMKQNEYRMSPSISELYWK